MKILRWINRKTGNRGKFLGFLAMLDLIYGYSLITLPVFYRDIDLLLPVSVWAWIWIASGVNCLTGAFISDDRLPFAVASLVKTFWGMLYAYLWLSSSPVPRPWASAAIWLTFAGIVIMISGWPEPADGFKFARRRSR